MSADFDDFDTALDQMGAGIRRARAAFDDADDGFIKALKALKVITQARGTLGEQFAELRDTVSQLQQMVMAQGDELRALRERLNGRH